MITVRRRRAARASVLAASFAVVASLVVAPMAQAEETPTAAEETAAPSTAASTDAPAPGTAAPEETPAPTADTAPTSSPPEAPTGDPGTVDAGDTVVGELVQAWPDPEAEEVLGHDHDEHADEAPLSWVQPAEGDAVRVPTEDLPAATVGSTVAVTVGDEVTDEASAEQGFDEAREVLDAQVLQAAAPDPTTAAAGGAPTNTITVVLVVPSGGTADSTTVTSVVNQLDGNVASFWAGQSNDTIRLDAVAGASGWITSSRPCSDPTGLWNDAAAQIGWSGGAGKHLMLYLPRTSTSCSYGLGTVGSSPGSGGVSYVRDVATSVMAHELGHNFGLGHSSAYQCDGAVETGTCQTRSYYDLYDVMGISWGQVGSLNSAQSSRLGLLPSAQRTALTPSSPATSVTLAPLSGSSGTRAVQLTASNGVVYWLEFRQGSGQDAWLGDSRNAYGLQSGVVLRRATSGADTSLLLDGSPSRSNNWSGDLQTALSVGRLARVADGDFAVSLTSQSATSASVRITTRASGGTGQPALQLQPSQQLSSGQTLVSPNGRYTVTMQSDGNLVSYGTGGRVTWASYVYSPGARLVVQPDGNVVEYSRSGQVLWHAGTYGNPGSGLTVRDDGSLAVVDIDGVVLWSTPADSPSRLSVGQQLFAGQSLVSPNGQFRLTLQSDGNLVSYGSGGRVLWATYAYSPGARLAVQPDGNVVEYSAAGGVLWHANTWNNPSASFVLRDDGSAAVVGSGGGVLWSSAADAPSTLRSGQQLFAGQALVSANGLFRLVMQADGNLVLYASDGSVRWASYVYAPGSRLIQQPDGNLVSYDSQGRVTWHAGTWGRSGATTVLQDTGRATVLTQAGAVLWQS